MTSGSPISRSASAKRASIWSTSCSMTDMPTEGNVAGGEEGRELLDHEGVVVELGQAGHGDGADHARAPHVTGNAPPRAA